MNAAESAKNPIIQRLYAQAESVKAGPPQRNQLLLVNGAWICLNGNLGICFNFKGLGYRVQHGAKGWCGKNGWGTSAEIDSRDRRVTRCAVYLSPQRGYIVIEEPF